MLSSYRGNIELAYIKDNELEKRWYESIRNGTPDYNVYDDEIYISDIWACWVLYSRKYLREVRKPKNGIITLSDKIKKVVDVGCGFGYTTLALKQMFRNAEVIGTNIEYTTQIKVGQELGASNQFDVISDYSSIGKNVDLVFASEYFEHFEKPIEHLLDVIECTETRAFLFANSFGTKSVGHFNEYKIDNKMIDGKKVSRIFHERLKKLGYVRVPTNMWNNKPDFWVKNES